MNELKSVNYSGPFGEEQVTCAMLTIDNVYSPFVLHNISEANKEYTFSLYIRSDTEGSITVGGETIETTTEWTNHTVTFIAKSIDVSIFFNVIGIYYLYNTQLEIGNLNTGWRPAVEDVEQSISDTRTYFDITSESIRGEVVASEGRMSSLIEQTAGAIRSEVSDTEGRMSSLIEQTVGAIRSEVSDIEGRMSSSIEQTASGITARLDGVESTANNASKTATNYLNFSDKGLIIGDHTASSLGRNVLIGSEYIDFRSGDTVLARYGDNTVKLGIGYDSNNTISVDLCDGGAVFGYHPIHRVMSLQAKRSMYIVANEDFEGMTYKSTSTYISTGGIHADTDENGNPRTLIASEKNLLVSPYSASRSRITVGLDYINMYAIGDGASLIEFNLISGSNTIEANAGSFKVSGSIYEGGTVLSQKYVGTSYTNGFWGLVPPSDTWIRTPGSGLLPAWSDPTYGGSKIGEYGWEFASMHSIQFCARSLGAVRVGHYIENSKHNGGIIVDENGSLGIVSYTAGIWPLSVDTGGSVHLGAKMIVPISGGAGIRPNGDNVYGAGNGSNRFTKVFAVNGIDTSSDEREKDILTDMNLEDYSNLFMDVKPIIYRWKHGEDKQIHFGVGAQTLERQFKEYGYDPTQYAIITHCELEEPTSTGQTDRYGMNYQDLQMLTLMQTQKNTRELEELKKLKETNTNLQAQVETLWDIVMQMYHESYVLKNTTH